MVILANAHRGLVAERKVKMSEIIS